MKSRKNSSFKQLFALLDDKRRPRQLAAQFFEEDLLRPAGKTFDQFFDFENDAIHAASSWIALRLFKDSKEDAAMLTAFKEAGLDHRNPMHWRELVAIFAEVHFGRVKTKPKKWDAEGLWRVWLDYSIVKKN